MNYPDSKLAHSTNGSPDITLANLEIANRLRTIDHPVAGDISFMDSNDDFNLYISKRKDIDTDGFFDIVGHGTSTTIEVINNGKKVHITHRAFARLLKNSNVHKGMAIRLLSCNTGHISRGFAQGLADRLGVPVMAPTEFLFANPNGTYFVQPGKVKNNRIVPDHSKPKGRFETFYPYWYKGGKRK